MDDTEFSSLVAASLEAFLHQLVFVMNVYPSDSFSKSTFLGIVGRTNRHPGVVDYISRCIDVAVPVLLGGGQMIVMICEDRFVLTMRIIPGQQQSLQFDCRQWESRLRDLILSVHSMERNKENCCDSFQVLLRPADDCHELVQAMSKGQWYQINQRSELEEGRLRPLFDSHSGDCEISFVALAYSSTSNS